MSSKTILAVLLLASLAGNASFLITTFSRRPARQAGAIDQLALTADQASKFEGSKRAFQDQRRMAHQKMAELRRLLADEFAKETPDRQRMVTTAVEMAQVQTGMRPKLIDHLLALHALITPAQRASFADLMRTGGGSGSVCPGSMLYPATDGER
jgi:Spy/CpxP family protein refolding chaperone